MNPTPAPKIPKYSQLPEGSAWGVFGDDDGIGCLNFLTPERLVEAAQLIRTGKVFRLDAKLGFAKPPLFGRASLVHKIHPLSPVANDDLLERYNTQEGSQWDGLGHVGHPALQRFYNNVSVEDIREKGNAKLGIHRWANKVVGRGTLIDAFAFRAAKGRPVQPLKTATYTLDDLKGALDAQKTTLKPGSILLIRTGWMEEYEKCTAEEKRDLAPFEKIQAAGIEASDEMLTWLWDNQVAAIGTDCPAVEPLPMDFTNLKLLHYRALPLLGLPLGELFVLAPLAEDCARDGRYEFFTVSTPLNVEGGIASPPNAVAIK